MAQFRKDSQTYLSDSKSVFEVGMLAVSNGQVVNSSHPLPVTLGADTITITGNVNVSTVVQVNSSPEQPVHNHITEVGTSDTLTVPYLPIGGNVVVTAMPNVQGNVSITAMPNVQGNVSITTMPNVQGNVSITAMPNVQGNVVVSGNVSITAMPNVQGNVSITALPNVSITAMPNVQGNVSITALPNVSITAMPNVQGNVSITAMPNVQGNVVVSGNVSITAMPNVQGNVSITALPNVSITAMPNVQGNVVVSGNVSITSMPSFGNVVITSNNSSPVLTKYADSFQLDTLGRLRTGSIQTQSWFAPSIAGDVFRFREKLNGTQSNSVFIANTSEVQITSGNTAAGYAIRQSNIRYKIVPGTSHAAYFTINFNANSSANSSVTRRVGLFDDGNGLFWEQNANTLAVVVRRREANGNILEDRTYANSFNVDKLDGTGPSGFNIFTSGLDKYYTLWFDFTGGRSGRIRFGLGTTAGAQIAHAFNYAGLISTNFITDNSLPTRREIRNSVAQSVNPTFNLSGSVFNYEAPRSFNPNLATGSHLAGFVPNTTITPLLTLGIRPGGVFYRADLTMHEVSIIDTNNTGKNSNPASFYYEVHQNANVNSTYAYNGNGALSTSDQGQASKFWTWANTATVSGGAVITSGIFTSDGGIIRSSSIPETFNLGTDVDNNTDTLTVCVRLLSAGGSAPNIVATANWLEQL
jgi:hypothetical protein